MHPMGIQNMLPMPIAMARAGLHVVTCTSRYPNNDTTLIMEKVKAKSRQRRDERFKLTLAWWGIAVHPGRARLGCVHSVLQREARLPQDRPGRLERRRSALRTLPEPGRGTQWNKNLYDAAGANAVVGATKDNVATYSARPSRPHRQETGQI